MADQHAAPTDGHPDMDYAEHEATYRLFIGLIKYGLIVSVLVIIFLAYFWA